MSDDEEVTIDDIKLWNVQALKDFLRSRKLKVSGRKDELVALVYAAKLMPALVPAPSSPATKAATKLKGYQDLLKTPDNGVLPDPQDLTDWESEASSVSKWPPTMAIDIGNYISNIDDVSLGKRLMSDYKEQKAYSYFASGWMKDIEYHGIEQNNKYCFLRSKCVPSQRVKDVPWSVWIAIEKVSGHIHSAFCTCFAGYSTTCNHVAALLFKVDFAWRNGITNPACTSRECVWSAFAGKNNVEPRRIADLT
ncbi:uncharacterized protein LOC117122990 [Anneissia japonica]|uniref:uncharacterized protein LOC117122990 n=1 Tax=Anneissia japonica TaxID=1529436 RepID=UPI0014258D9A|nr:uncharacterized protein LOC117122990 [Anneissia japonica]